ncbi:LacI family DNA-binding transcriptional regulator [Anaerolineales bacterium HSG6]|nr:LacI family DNA-binding transcriptional regulator [Anaerolineales bacterium HSG6]MDM8530665.1 LacI family DNA-binding transcriptional regulator [Anaerolineales bacterium HSG25]
MAITMKDVAEKAGVSIKTVSRVVNNQGEISAETRQRIEAIIAELGYRPNLVARSLITQRTLTIGLIVVDITNPFFAEVARGVQDVARQNGYNVLLCNIDDNLHEQQKALESLAAHSVDGIILFPLEYYDDRLLSFVNQYRPVVLINHLLQHPNVAVVLLDGAHGVQQAVNHLLERGHQEIAMLAGPKPITGRGQRLQGYQTALQGQGLADSANRVIFSIPTQAQGYEQSKQLLSQHPHITAIIAYNDLLAFGVIQACRELNIVIPDQCAIVGFDDIYFSNLVHPALSTVRVNKYEVGQQAMTRLLTMINDPKLTISPIKLGVELIVRESS